MQRGDVSLREYPSHTAIPRLRPRHARSLSMYRQVFSAPSLKWRRRLSTTTFLLMKWQMRPNTRRWSSLSATALIPMLYIPCRWSSAKLFRLGAGPDSLHRPPFRDAFRRSQSTAGHHKSRTNSATSASRANTSFSLPAMPVQGTSLKRPLLLSTHTTVMRPTDEHVCKVTKTLCVIQVNRTICLQLYHEAFFGKRLKK